MNRLHEILRGEAKPGLYRFSSVSAHQRVRREAERQGWVVARLDGREIKDKASFLKAAARELKFPASYGQNWDAFEEAIRDLSWLRNAPSPAPDIAKPKGFIVLYDEAGTFARAEPEDWATAKDILQSAAQEWSATSTPMFALLRGANIAAADAPLL